jgi:1-deoxy-D-xylulose 5-phosphate reductoisomerase
MSGEIRFLQIAEVVETVLDAYRPHEQELTLDAIAEADEWSRRQAAGVVRTLRGAR